MLLSDFIWETDEHVVVFVYIPNMLSSAVVSFSCVTMAILVSHNTIYLSSYPASLNSYRRSGTEYWTEVTFWGSSKGRNASLRYVNIWDRHAEITETL